MPQSPPLTSTVITLLSTYLFRANNSPKQPLETPTTPTPLATIFSHEPLCLTSSTTLAPALASRPFCSSRCHNRRAHARTATPSSHHIGITMVAPSLHTRRDPPLLHQDCSGDLQWPTSSRHHCLCSARCRNHHCSTTRIRETCVFRACNSLEQT